MDITILIINWNSGDRLGSLLDSLKEFRIPNSRILVIDNASSDSSQACVADHPLVELERLEENTGFAAAVNRGFGNSSSKYVLLLNPDITFEDCNAAVKDLHRAVGMLERAGILTCPLRGISPKDNDRQAAFQFRPYPNLLNTMGELFFLDEFFEWIGFRRKHGAPSSGVSKPVELEEQPAAAFWLVNRPAWEAVGGMDERFYPAWFEDVDFCLRLKRAGWKLYLINSSSRIFHRGGQAAETLGFSRFMVVYYRNLLRFWWKHNKVSWPLIASAVGLGLVARIVIFQAGLFPGERRSNAGSGQGSRV